MAPPRCCSTGAGRPFFVIDSTVFARSSRTPSSSPLFSSIWQKRRKSGAVDTRPTAPSISAGRVVNGTSASISKGVSPPACPALGIDAEQGALVHGCAGRDVAQADRLEVGHLSVTGHQRDGAGDLAVGDGLPQYRGGVL